MYPHHSIHPLNNPIWCMPRRFQHPDSWPIDQTPWTLRAMPPQLLDFYTSEFNFSSLGFAYFRLWNAAHPIQAYLRQLSVFRNQTSQPPEGDLKCTQEVYADKRSHCFAELWAFGPTMCPRILQVPLSVKENPLPHAWCILKLWHILVSVCVWVRHVVIWSEKSHPLRRYVSCSFMQYIIFSEAS